ncbi:plastocyanin/azurin family copper-binding protein [Niveispirillum sp.]|uniref:cupredoxin domain-containing protein n=1 Tax=Niveispirillum sp. TaxID=1917217 RepID=UPI001B69E49A|nr:plastocyanin/azurin family copper-binding protein [Niveispirillum sp.]MBP7337202.1 cupredoxin domain-containing protein [Niveispirillum sp.]
MPRQGVAALRVFLPLAVLGVLAGSGGAQAPKTIAQRDISFVPRTVSIKVGEQVVFRNDDPFGHNVYSPAQENIFDIGLQEPGTETPVTFSVPGEFTIQCRIHPKMRAKVTVTP